MQNNSLSYNYGLISRLNKAAGNLDSVTYTSLHKQCLLIQEELNETLYKGIFLKDPKELLDGCCDVLVTAFGFMQMLDAAGFDTHHALSKVCENNDTKLISTDAVASADETIQMYANQNVQTALFYNEATHCYVVKDTNGKIRKPKGYVSVDLSDCLGNVKL